MIELLQKVVDGDVKSLARAISLVENKVDGYDVLLQNLPPSNTYLIGITGPPGAGKSTLTDALIGQIIESGKRVGVLCVDPSSPFKFGALLGDRIRMSQWYQHPQVYIRSLASRGALGGLHPSIIEIVDVMKAANFDYIIIETVGVGQSEVEIAGLADTTVVVLVPESGDEVQSMKAGLMEIANIIVVNKADRPDADIFARNLRQMLAPAYKDHIIAVMKTVASENKGVKELMEKIIEQKDNDIKGDLFYTMLAEKAYHLIREMRMRSINKGELKTSIEQQSLSNSFNLYNFVKQFQ